MTTPLHDVQLANIALSRIGSVQVITSIDPLDGSNESQQVALHFVHARDELMRSFPWPWANKFAALVQVSTAGVRANDEWFYSYRYPTDAIAVRKVFATEVVPAPPAGVVPQLAYSESWRRAEGDALPWSFSIGSDASGKLVYTDLINARCKYTAEMNDSTLWPHDFADLFTWKLAVDLAFGLANSESRRADAVKMFKALETGVRAAAFNESQSDIPNIDYQSEAVRARFAR